MDKPKVSDLRLANTAHFLGLPPLVRPVGETDAQWFRRRVLQLLPFSLWLEAELDADETGQVASLICAEATGVANAVIGYTTGLALQRPINDVLFGTDCDWMQERVKRLVFLFQPRCASDCDH